MARRDLHSEQVHASTLIITFAEGRIYSWHAA